MSSPRVKKSFGSISLVILTFAMVMCVVAAIDGIRLAVGPSVIGGIAVIAIAAILFTIVGWRVQTKWRDLRKSR